MPDKALSYDPEWQKTCRGAIVSAEQAVTHIAAGQRVFLGTGCAQPQELVRALVSRAGELVDTEIVHLLTLGEAPYAGKQLAAHFNINSFFIAENVRDIIQQGLGNYTPIFLSDIPRLFSSGKLPLDVALIQVSPPDKEGFCSLGISVDIVKSAAENARLVIAQVNPKMPRTHGNSMIHMHEIDYLVPVDMPLIENPRPEVDDTTRQIGRYISSLVENGSTMELGIGRIPHAVLEFLSTKKDLGIHTEMVSDEIIDLIESGVITGARKSLDRGRVVASFAVGSQRLYDYLDDNPVFAFHPTEYVNDPFIIGRQHKMVAINVALEIDLTGQVCADSLGTRFYSGIGGQVDFNRGAARAEGGLAIIACPSTAKSGEVSRIVPRLSPGAGVVTTRGDVHYVVTEYGVAYLHGKNIQERTLAMVSIAHPDYREELLRAAIEMHYVSEEFAEVSGKLQAGMSDLQTSYLMDDGTQLSIRPIHVTDEPKLRHLFYQLSQQSLYTRFMSMAKWVSHKQVQEFVYIDHRHEVSIVGTVPEADGEHVIALGGYFLDEETNRAEVAFVVQDDWQGRGIGTFLFEHLISIAKQSGIGGFTAEVLTSNASMQAVIRHAGLKTRSSVSEGVMHFEMDFN